MCLSDFWRFRGWGLRFGGFGLRGLGLAVWGFGVQDLGLRVEGTEHRVYSKVQGVGFGVLCSVL